VPFSAVLELFERFVPRRVLRFGLVGVSGVLVNLAVFALLSDVLHIDDMVSLAIAVEASILSNFFFNNEWTFGDKNAAARVGFSARLIRYNLVSLVGMAIQLGSFRMITMLMMNAMHLDKIGMWKYPAQLVGIAIAMAWNFLTNFFWTWAQQAEGRTS
jgi:dolichol-phosphate mannosyltransferase